MKNVLFIFNSNGINEIVDIDEVGVGDVGKEEWEVIEGIESNIIEEYSVFDGIVRVEYVEGVSEEEVLEEVNIVDKNLW